jgi:hypothetical protein
MALYKLTSSFLRTDIIEDFITIIWTERYSEAGDFVITLPMTEDNLNLLAPGDFLAYNDSTEVGLIDTVVIENNEMRIEGKFLVWFLKNRIIRSSTLWSAKNYSITDQQGAIATRIVSAMCVNGGLGISGAYPPIPGGQNEVIPNLVVSPLTGGSNVTYEAKYGPVYDAVEEVCKLYSLGFDLKPTGVSVDGYTLTFRVYKGRDLTSSQSTYPVVFFQSALDSLVNVKELRSLANYKNVAYAYLTTDPAADDPFVIGLRNGVAYVDGGDTAIGWDRRTMILFVDDFTFEDAGSSTTTLGTALDKKAKNALINNNYVRMVDGQIVPQVNYTYGVEYLLGDVIELRTNNNIQSTARITEYIRSHDANGEVAYPTLSIIS